MAVKVSWPINSVYYKKRKRGTVISWPCDCSYFRYVEEGPHRKDCNQAHRHSIACSSSLTSQGKGRNQSPKTMQKGDQWDGLNEFDPGTKGISGRQVGFR